MKTIVILFLLMQTSAAFASYNCKLKVKNNRVNLDSDFVFDGNNTINTTLGDFRFRIFKATQSTGEETYTISISHSYGASTTIFTPGSKLVAHAINSGEPGAIVQAVCRKL